MVTLVVASQGCARSSALPIASAPNAVSVSCMTGSGVEIAPPEAPVPELAPSDDDHEADVIRPCKAGTPEHDDAKQAVSKLADSVRDLADDGDPAPVTAELEKLLETTCFELSAGELRDDLTFESAVSLKTWWWDGGGEGFVEHYLELDQKRTSVVPASPRRALTTAKAPKSRLAKDAKPKVPPPPHPLAPLFCSATDAVSSSPSACGRETAGWVMRAERTFERRAAADFTSYGGKTEEMCSKEADAAEPAQRYSVYRSCLDDVAPRRDALPLGHFKAPADGWLVIGGPERRRNCTDLRAYDLATGAAYIATGCGTKIDVKLGRLPVAALREAAWMMMMAHVTEERVRTDAHYYELPKGMAISRPRTLFGGTGGSSRCVGGGTQRSWSWMRSKNGALVGQTSGVLRWTGGITEGEDHAAELLAIAEDSLAIGCSPAPPPSRITWSSPGPVAETGQVAQFDDPATEPIRLALTTPTPRVACSRNDH